MIDNVIVSNLANQNKAPYDLIKKQAENKGLLVASLNAQISTKNFKLSNSGQLQPKNNIQSNSNSAPSNSQLSRIQKFSIAASLQSTRSTLKQ